MYCDRYDEVIAQLERAMRHCSLCPRDCGVDRLAGEKGWCRTGSLPYISSYAPHFGEERPLVGYGGSGTIFFAYCNLGCVYCQNWEISAEGEGTEVSCEELAAMMLTLQKRDCHNINFVTPTHQIYAIVKALQTAQDNGLALPLVYNCGGYESVETLRVIDGIFDIYMPDFKYGDNEAGNKYSGVSDYFDRASESIIEMHRQTGDFTEDDRGIMKRGILLRHLVLPNNIANSTKVLEFLATRVSKKIYLNIMDQYYPAYKSARYPELSRHITSLEYDAVVREAERLGFEYIADRV